MLQLKSKNLSCDRFISVISVPFSGGDRKCFHVSSILYTSRGSTSNVNFDVNELINKTETFSNLQLVPFVRDEAADEVLVPESESSSYAESFPWMVDESGQTIDYKKPIGLFDNIRLMSRFISSRYSVDSNLISEPKLMEILNICNNKEITVLELFNLISKLYNENIENILNVVRDSLDSNQPHEPTVVNTVVDVVENLDSSRPLGKYGQVTINEVLVYLRNLKWDMVLDRTEITFNAAPVVFNFISFSLLLRGYMKHVHNRPYEKGISKQTQIQIRNRNLVGFLFVGAPLVLFTLKKSGILLKDMVTVHTTLTTQPNISIDTNIINTNIKEGGILLIISNLSKNIPNSLKLVFSLFMLCLVVIKLLGFNSIFDVFLNLYYLKLYIYITSSLLILYQILNLYLLHKFSKNTISISPILPVFILNWLTEFKEISSTEDGIQVLKKMCYVQISLYISIIVFITLI